MSGASGISHLPTTTQALRNHQIYVSPGHSQLNTAGVRMYARHPKQKPCIAGFVALELKNESYVYIVLVD